MRLRCSTSVLDRCANLNRLLVTSSAERWTGASFLYAGRGAFVAQKFPIAIVARSGHDSAANDLITTSLKLRAAAAVGFEHSQDTGG